MLMKSAFIAALILAANPPARADPFTARDCGLSGTHATEPDARPHCLATPLPRGVLHTHILVLAPDPLGDIMNARGPDLHAGALARFAAYASIGNRDGAQIISGQLRAFGVAPDQLRDFADRAALHTGAIPPPVRTD